MKLICVNNKTIILEVNNSEFHCHGQDLTEGVIYETKGESFKDQYGHECYYIIGMGPYLTCRFTKALDQNASNVKEESKADETVKKALEKALEEENYEEANRLSELLKS
jgi:hypothetical protein